jgi:hypothetical protein
LNRGLVNRDSRLAMPSSCTLGPATATGLFNPQ